MAPAPIEVAFMQHFLMELAVTAALGGVAFGLLFVVIEFAYKRAHKNFGTYWDRSVTALEGINKSLEAISQKDREK
jgi:hypothetical protein